MFVIVNAANLYWSNANGWNSIETATVFTALERDTLRLPLGGMWMISPR